MNIHKQTYDMILCWARRFHVMHSVLQWFKVATPLGNTSVDILQWKAYGKSPERKQMQNVVQWSCHQKSTQTRQATESEDPLDDWFAAQYDFDLRLGDFKSSFQRENASARFKLYDFPLGSSQSGDSAAHTNTAKPHGSNWAPIPQLCKTPKAKRTRRHSEAMETKSSLDCHVLNWKTNISSTAKTWAILGIHICSIVCSPTCQKMTAQD